MIIPSGIFNLYYQGVDSLINNPYIGRSCKAVSEQIIDCTNCNENEYDGGGNPFSQMCPYCGGTGSLKNLVEQTLNLRVYDSPKTWIKVGNIDAVQGRVQVIGFMTDIDKIQKSDYILIYTDTILSLKYKLASNIFPHGFGSRYFICYLDLCSI